MKRHLADVCCANLWLHEPRISDTGLRAASICSNETQRIHNAIIHSYWCTAVGVKFLISNLSLRSPITTNRSW